MYFHPYFPISPLPAPHLSVAQQLNTGHCAMVTRWLRDWYFPLCTTSLIASSPRRPSLGCLATSGGVAVLVPQGRTLYVCPSNTARINTQYNTIRIIHNTARFPVYYLTLAWPWERGGTSLSVRRPGFTCLTWSTGRRPPAAAPWPAAAVAAQGADLLND